MATLNLRTILLKLFFEGVYEQTSCLEYTAQNIMNIALPNINYQRSFILLHLFKIPI